MGGNHTVTALPPQLSDDLELLVEPEEVLSVRYLQKGAMNGVEALIKWKGLPAIDAT